MSRLLIFTTVLMLQTKSWLAHSVVYRGANSLNSQHTGVTTLKHYLVYGITLKIEIQCQEFIITTEHENTIRIIQDKQYNTIRITICMYKDLPGCSSKSVVSYEKVCCQMVQWSQMRINIKYFSNSDLSKIVLWWQLVSDNTLTLHVQCGSIKFTG